MDAGAISTVLLGVIQRSVGRADERIGGASVFRGGGYTGAQCDVLVGELPRDFATYSLGQNKAFGAVGGGSDDGKLLASMARADIQIADGVVEPPRPRRQSSVR